MSADNGVYILKTKRGDGWEYRVAHLQAVENYLWNQDTHEETSDEDVHIKNAREMWNGPVFSSKQDALREADLMAEEILNDDFCPVLEYGISTITIPREF